MKKLSFLSALLIACLIIPLFPTSIVAESTHSTISGTISLPNNEPAPTGGVKIILNVETDNLTSKTGDDISINQELTIAKGQAGITYSIMVPKSSNKEAKYNVSYKTESNYAPFGWYSKDGTTPIKEKSTQVNLNAGDVKNVNIKILEGKKISGKMILGNMDVAPSNDLIYTITAIQEGSNKNSKDDDIIVSNKITVEKGNKEKAWSLIVPLNQPGKGYKLFYQFEKGGYKEEGYYYIDGTSRSSNKVTLIDVSNTVAGLNLTTLPFTNIEGKIYLPENVKAPKNGFDAIITAKNYGSSAAATDDIYFMKEVKIAEGSNSAAYSLTVPVKPTGYILSYAISDSKGYITEGYYSTKKTESSEKDATLIITGNKAVTGIELDIIKKVTATPTPTLTPIPTITPSPKPTPLPGDIEKYDLNNDGFINIKDLIELAKVIVDQYKDAKKEDFKEQYNGWQMSNDDIKILREAFKPYYNNRYDVKWFNGSSKWFKIFDLDLEDFESMFNSDNFEYKLDYDEDDYDDDDDDYDFDDFKFDDCDDKNYNWFMNMFKNKSNGNGNDRDRNDSNGNNKSSKNNNKNNNSKSNKDKNKSGN